MPKNKTVIVAGGREGGKNTLIELMRNTTKVACDLTFGKCSFVLLKEGFREASKFLDRNKQTILKGLIK